MKVWLGQFFKNAYGQVRPPNKVFSADAVLRKPRSPESVSGAAVSRVLTFLPPRSACGASREAFANRQRPEPRSPLGDDAPETGRFRTSREGRPIRTCFLCDTLAWRGVCDIPGGYGLNDLALHTRGRFASVGPARQDSPAENLRRAVNASADFAPRTGPGCDSPYSALVFPFPHGMRAIVRSSRPLRSPGTRPAGA